MNHHHIDRRRVARSAEQIERVAHAMWEARAAYCGEVSMPMANDERRELFRAYALAAIAAMESRDE